LFEESSLLSEELVELFEDGGRNLVVDVVIIDQFPRYWTGEIDLGINLATVDW